MAFFDWFWSILLLFLLSTSFYFYFPIFENIYWQLFTSFPVCERLHSNFKCFLITIPKAKSERINGEFCFDKFLNYRIMWIHNWEVFLSHRVRMIWHDMAPIDSTPLGDSKYAKIFAWQRLLSALERLKVRNSRKTLQRLWFINYNFWPNFQNYCSNE